MDETLERTFAVGDNPRLLVKNPRGSISIRPGDAGVITVSAQVAGADGRGHAQVRMSQDEDGGVVLAVDPADTDTLRRIFGMGQRMSRVGFDVQVPVQTEVTAKAVDSSIDVAGISGPVVAKSVSGLIRAVDLSGPVTLRSISGQVEARNISGQVELSNVSGRIHISESRVPALRAKSISGQLVAETDLGAGPHVLSTVSGSGELILPEEASLTVRSKTVSGHVSMGIPGSASNAGNGGYLSRKQTFEINGGGPEVVFKSVSGHLKIQGPQAAEIHEEPSGQAVSTEMDAEEPEGKMDRMEVLRQLERGEISAEEAVALLS